MKLTSNPNAGHKAPSYEQVTVDTPYSFSYSPSDLHQYWYTDFNKKTTNNNYNKLKRKQLFMHYHKQFLTKVFNGIANLTLNLEYSPSGRLHYHGTIRIYDVEELYSTCLDRLRQVGTYEIDTISDNDKWNTYCTKQNLQQIDILGYIETERSLNEVYKSD